MATIQLAVIYHNGDSEYLPFSQKEWEELADWCDNHDTVTLKGPHYLIFGRWVRSFRLVIQKEDGTTEYGQQQVMR